MIAHDVPTPRPAPADDGERPTAHSSTLLPLLFALRHAAALPPAALLAPPGAARPTLRPEPNALLDPPALAAALGHPAAEVGRGRVALGELDARLGGLTVSLEAFRVADGDGALACLGVVRPDPTASDGGATVVELWWLARAALARHRVPRARWVGLGEDALLAVHGGRTAQVAWLAGDRLATAGVTRLADLDAWAIGAARALAVLADARLAREDGRAG
jgi:hypothetical protein